MLENRNILVGVTGGIAAYKAAALVSMLKKRGANVRVMMTKNACRFVTPVTFEALSGQMVVDDVFEKEYEIGHISLARWSDACVIAPATANCMAKMAAGIGDDIVTTVLLALRCPVFLAPAMNSAMWSNPATQSNRRTLEGRGVLMIGPASGRLACGDEGEGRMSEPEEIADALERYFGRTQDMKGLKVMVTAGPTVERIDPVRYITNRSTGKMGFSIARAAAARGAEVTLVTGPVSLSDPAGVRTIRIESSADLFREVTYLAPSQDVVIQAAAPADYTPEKTETEKIKKKGEDLVLRLVPTRDIARAIGEKKESRQTFVIFAAETNDLTENAVKKLGIKNADMVVANDVTKPGAGFASDTNIVTLITKDGMRDLPLASKDDVAGEILDAVMEIRGKNE